MFIKCIPTGMFDSNTYVIGENQEGIIIDAGADSKDVTKIVNENNLKIRYIVLTHGHIDHICCAYQLSIETGAEICIHENEKDWLSNPRLNLSAFFGENSGYEKPQILLKNGDILEAGALKFEIIHTPGHTPGGICIKVRNDIFTGDTLFKGSIGRIDLPNGNMSQLLESIKSRLMSLDDSIVVYSGHGPATTIGEERRSNPFIT
jgi:glyoxylase-like metal-dependent hydrolase (beta-lactamase superfamily II)